MRILLVDDDEEFRFALGSVLRLDGFEVLECGTASQATQAVQRSRPDVALVDLGLPDACGTSLIANLRALGNPPAIVCLTGNDATESVIAAMRAGAADYLVKPVRSAQIVVAVRNAASAATRSKDAHARVVAPLGRSAAWLDILDLCARVATADRSKVLITGESGTGKDVVARYIHALSDRSEQPCIVVNCACLSSELAEAEIFGHEAGSFTGARGRRRGVLELAHGGTLFLDEIGELPMPMQAKLLRVIEDRRFRRIGSEREIEVDVRFVFATNRPLRQRAEAGLFRWDLYQRLAVLEIELPPVRARAGDVRVLVEGLSTEIAAGIDIASPQFADDVWPLLERHRWPGNVRELRNFLERAMVLSTGVVTASLVRQLLPECAGSRGTHPDGSLAPPLTPDDAVGCDAAESLLPLQRNAVVPDSRDASASLPPVDLQTAVLNHCERTVAWADGNLSAAARQLGISRNTLRRHLCRD